MTTPPHIPREAVQRSCVRCGRPTDVRPVKVTPVAGTAEGTATIYLFGQCRRGCSQAPRTGPRPRRRMSRERASTSPSNGWCSSSWQMIEDHQRAEVKALPPHLISVGRSR